MGETGRGGGGRGKGNESSRNAVHLTFLSSKKFFSIERKKNVYLYKSFQHLSNRRKTWDIRVFSRLILYQFFQSKPPPPPPPLPCQRMAKKTSEKNPARGSRILRESCESVVIKAIIIIWRPWMNSLEEKLQDKYRHGKRILKSCALFFSPLFAANNLIGVNSKWWSLSDALERFNLEHCQLLEPLEQTYGQDGMKSTTTKRQKFRLDCFIIIFFIFSFFFFFFFFFLSPSRMDPGVKLQIISSEGNCWNHYWVHCEELVRIATAEESSRGEAREMRDWSGRTSQFPVKDS